MQRNVLPLASPSNLVMSNALGDLLGSISREYFPPPAIVSTLSRMTHRHFWMASLGASRPSDIRLKNLHVPSSFLASLSAKVVDAKADRTTAARQTDLQVIMG